MLGACLGEDPRSLVFRRDPEGKPWLCRAPGERTLAFNLSHSGTLAALAVSALPLDTGIDVEAQRGARRFDALARRYFSEPEQAAVCEAEKGDLAGVFYDIWTLKEAWLKARGSGIRVPLADFGFHRAGRLLAFSATHALEPRPADWRFWSWRIEGRASLALAIRDPGMECGEPQIHLGMPLGRWVPLPLDPRAATHW